MRSLDAMTKDVTFNHFKLIDLTILKYVIKEGTKKNKKQNQVYREENS